MATDSARPFQYSGGEVLPGETAHVRYPISETYLGDPVRVPVTIVNGSEPGPTAFLSAAVHGDELNGIEVVRHVADEWDHAALHGTVVCLHVLNVPGFEAQTRYLPLTSADLNREFPGKRRGNAAQRIAAEVFSNFVEPCDIGIDLHTSTRGRTNMFHVRGDLAHDDVARIAHAFGAHVVIDEDGPDGSLRTAATDAGTPTVTVEMGEARRFQRAMITRALDGVWSVFAEFGLYPADRVRWPGWRTVVHGDEERHWLRADAGGIVEMHVAAGAFVREGEQLCTITNPFEKTLTTVEAPFAGVVVGVLENPVVWPGNPLCHLARVHKRAREVLERRTDGE